MGAVENDLVRSGEANGGWLTGDRVVKWVRPLVVFFASYAILPMVGFLDMDPTVPRQVAGLALVAGYIALYVRVTWKGLARPFTNRTPRTLAAMTVLAVPLVLVLGRAGGDLALYWLLGCYTLSLRRRWWLPLLGVALGTEFVTLLAATDLSWALIGVSLLRTIGYSILLMGFYQLVHVLIELSEARAALAKYAVTEERLKFARDLHDLLGQRLSATALRAELAGRLAGDDSPRASTEAFAAAELARDALAEVRETVAGYRRMSLADELDNAAPLLTAAGVDLEVDAPGEPLATPVDEHGAWVVREGVTNIVRHAGASTCWISVRDGNPVVVQVSDDGRGAERGWGNGLTGLADRLERVGARLTTSEDGGRFHLRAEFSGQAKT